MGGQFEYFGLYLDTDYGNGRSGADCTTFNSPQLSGKPSFSFTEIEIWGIGPDPKVKAKEVRIKYRQTSNISCTKSLNLNVSCLVLQLSLPNPLKPGVKSRMKM